jgi:hypothetical protein
MCLFTLSSGSYMHILSMDRFESLLFKLEVLDHKARERADLLTAPLGSPISVLLRFETAIEVKLFLGSLCVKNILETILFSVLIVLAVSFI